MANEDGDLVFARREEEKSGWMVPEIGKVRSLQGCARRKSVRFGEIKAEGKLAFEPGLDGVAVGGEHLRCGSRGERGEVLIQKLGGEHVLGATDAPGCERDNNQEKKIGRASCRERV